MSKISVEEIAQNAVHFGHKAVRWNPKMKSYIYNERRGIHMIDLEKTKTHLEKLLDFLKKKAEAGASILFVSTKPQTRVLFEEFHRETGFPCVTSKWVGGMLTNFSTIRERIKYLKSIREMISTGEITKFTKKEQSKLIKEKEKLEYSLGGITELFRVPDVLFVVDGKRDESAIREARKLRIPVVGFADTNVDPDLYDLLVPANDDAISSLTYLLSFVFDTVKSNNKKHKPSSEKVGARETEEDQGDDEDGMEDISEETISLEAEVEEKEEA